MSFNPPPPPPPMGEGSNPGEVPGYPGPGQVPPHMDPPPPPYSGEQTSPYTAPPAYPGEQAPQYPGAQQFPGQYPGAQQFPGQYAAGGQQTLQHPNAVIIMVMGILGLLACGPLGIVAWVMGNKAIREIDSSGQHYENRGTVQAGRVIGIIATIFLIIGVVAFGFILALGGFAVFLDGAY